MRIVVRLLGTHRSFLPSGARGGMVELEFPGATVTLAEIRGRLGMPPQTPRIVFHQGNPIDDDHQLVDRDEVVFVSPVGGG
ncbi:MAG: hypothetical protein M5U22_11490 [Thermoleophilia bacterium]|nr:hypothetical protein [Thermoleophilia bacterium]